METPNHEIPSSLVQHRPQVKPNRNENCLHVSVRLDDPAVYLYSKLFGSGVRLGRCPSIPHALSASNFPLCGHDWKDEDGDCEVDECGPRPRQNGLQSVREIFVVGGWPIHCGCPDHCCEGHVDPDDDLT